MEIKDLIAAAATLAAPLVALRASKGLRMDAGDLKEELETAYAAVKALADEHEPK